MHFLQWCKQEFGEGAFSWGKEEGAEEILMTFILWLHQLDSIVVSLGQVLNGWKTLMTANVTQMCCCYCYYYFLIHLQSDVKYFADAFFKRLPEI